VATQLERRTATRTRLLDAALDVLVEAGIGGFTTTEVGRRAGLSQGAIFRHFPTKADLLAATVEHLYAGVRSRYHDQLARLRGDLDPADRLRIGIVVLWELFQDERLLAAYDLYAASRTDDALREDLRPVVQANGDSIHALAEAVFGRAVTVSPTRFHTMVDLVVCTMQGLVTSPRGLIDPDVEQRVVTLLSDLTLAVVAGTLPAPTGGSGALA
jgi:AcrR family transcriptional regulator